MRFNTSFSFSCFVIILVLELTIVAHSFSVRPLATSRLLHLQLGAVPIQNNGVGMLTTASVSNRFSREEGLAIVDTKLLPVKDYGDRIRYGSDAQGIDPATAIAGDDPRMTLAYGEFPTRSVDELLDLALPHVVVQQRQGEGDPVLKMLDLGSGCGRLVSYLALTRGAPDRPWAVHGVEISDILHTVAVGAVEIGGKETLFFNAEEDSRSNHGQNLLSLHLGAAEDMVDVLGKVQLIFAYCTAFKTNGFSQELGAMILDREWSELLASSCQTGCVVVTTDRALDPQHGWELLERLDVGNREVMGSTGYVQVLR